MQTRVAHLRNTWLAPTETWIYEQIRHLPPDVVNHVVCRTVKNLERFPIANLQAIGMRGWRHRLLAKLRLQHGEPAMTQALRRVAPHVVHSHFGQTAWEHHHAVDCVGARHVVTYYGMDVTQLPQGSRIWRERYTELFAAVDTVLCEGPHMAGEIRALGCAASKVRVHHLGVRVEELGYRPRSIQTNRVLRVLIAAAFREKKGIPFAIEALGRLRGTVPFRVTIIGDATADPRAQAEKRRILDAINQHSLESVTTMVGFRPHAEMLTAAYDHDVFLSPSIRGSDGDTEGGAPVSIIEMMATGMPVISTTHCDIPNVVVHGESGLLAPERDVDGLCSHLRWLWSNPGEWERIGAAARHRVETQFNARTQGLRLASMYRELRGEQFQHTRTAGAVSSAD